MSSNAATRHAQRVWQMVGSAANDTSHPGRPIAQSWHRCLDDYALDPGAAHHTIVLPRCELKEHQDRIDHLLKIARVEMNELYEQIAGSGFAILLTDADGIIINHVCDGTLDRPFRRAGLWLGANWSEAHEGTNGIGTCIIENRPITVHRDEHFRSRHIGLTCSAAPICDPHGSLLAVLDASSVRSRDTRQSQYHTQVLVKMSARLIENCNFLREFRHDRVLRFHSRPEYVGLLNEAMLAIDEAGVILAANPNAVALLEAERRADLTGKAINELLNITPATLQERTSRPPLTPWPVRDLRNGRRYFASLHVPAASSRARSGSYGKSLSHAPESEPGLADIAGSDSRMAHNVRCAERVIDKRVTIILQGETGTGKEVLAHALHLASDRAERPFIPVNCASIPESLIESELFGYKHGAFTGARREGMKGKILQSSGGTLFLDEIGDMPPQSQTRLLRVLEENQVTPLGCDKPIAIDLHVISATHKNLEEAVTSGQFREDLYYRLNGLTLTLVPVRERQDKDELIGKLLAAERGARSQASIDPEALARLMAYDWPGNIRQLKNVLRTALALNDTGVLRLRDLPDRIANPAPPAIAQPCADEELLVAQADVSVDRSNPLLAAEREAILLALAKNCWNISNAAASLGTSRNTLYRKLKRHGLPLSRPA